MRTELVDTAVHFCDTFIDYAAPTPPKAKLSIHLNQNNHTPLKYSITFATESQYYSYRTGQDVCTTVQFLSFGAPTISNQFPMFLFDVSVHLYPSSSSIKILATYFPMSTTCCDAAAMPS